MWIPSSPRQRKDRVLYQVSWVSSNDYDEFFNYDCSCSSLLHPFSVDQLCYVWICCLWFSWLVSPSMLNTRFIRLLSTSWFYWIVLQCNLFPELSCFPDFLIWHGMSHELEYGVILAFLSCLHRLIFPRRLLMMRNYCRLLSLRIVLTSGLDRLLLASLA